MPVITSFYRSMGWMSASAVLLGFLLLSDAAALTHERYMALTTLTFNVTLPIGGVVEEHFTAAEFQRDVARFLAGTGPPPLSASFRIVIQEGLHEVLISDCLACFVVAHLFAIEALLFTAPDKALQMLQDTMRMVSEWNPLPWEVEAWGLQQIIDRVAAVQKHTASYPHVDGPTLDLVIARCGEDLSWLFDDTLAFPLAKTRLWLWDKCSEHPTELAVRQALASRFTAGLSIHVAPNQGMESLAYARHTRMVVEGLVRPAEYTLFLQAQPFQHLDVGLFKLVVQAIREGTLSNNPVGFLHLNNVRFTTVQSICLMDLYKRLVPIAHETTLFGAYCCSQFMVHRSRIATVAPDTIKLVQGIVGDPEERRPQDLLCSQDDSHDARPGIAMSALFETLWQVVFKAPHLLPLRQDDASLPIFLQNAHDWSGGRGSFDYHLYYQHEFAI